MLIPFVRLLDRRLCVTQTEIDKILSYNWPRPVGVPLRHQDKFTELNLYVNLPDSAKLTIKHYYH